MDELQKRRFRELAHALQTVYFYYNQLWLTVDQLEVYISANNTLGAQEFLNWLRAKVVHDLSHDYPYPHPFRLTV